MAPMNNNDIRALRDMGAKANTSGTMVRGHSSCNTKSTVRTTN